MDIFETKICPITGLKLEVKDEWQLQDGEYSCKIGVIGESIIISEPMGNSIKKTTEMFLKTFSDIVKHYSNTKKFILIDNYSNFKEATNEARRAYIDYLNNHPQISMIVYIGLSRKLYLSVNIGKMINYLYFPVKISKSYEDAIQKSIKQLSKTKSNNNIFFNNNLSLKPIKEYQEPKLEVNKDLIEILKNPAVTLYIEEFNRFITNIKWNDNNYTLEEVSPNLEENHPLVVLREALSIVKSDVNELINDFIKQNKKLKETQRNLEDLNANLEKLVELRTRELAESNKKLKIAKEEAELANRGKAVFLASISHELKTPLNSILSYSSMGVSKIDRLSKDKIITYFSQVNTSGKRLLSLVESLIDITKFEAGVLNFNFSENDMLLTIKNAIAEISSLSEKKNIEIKLINNLLNSTFIFDRNRILQVFVNILFNSIKFSPQNKTICIKIENIENDFFCSVKDEGLGINKEELESIFEVFKRGKNSSLSSGTGLGLAISRNIIKAHNGKIWAENNEDKGARFIFTIPISQ